MSLRPWFAAVLATILIVTAASAAAGGQPPEEVPDHPALAEVVAMAAAGVSDEVILTRLEQLGSVPELDGHAVAALRTAGVSDRVLLRLVQMAGEPDASPAPAPAEKPAKPEALTSVAPGPVQPEAPPPEPPPAVPEHATKKATGQLPAAAPVSGGRIIVEIERSFPIHYVEVVVDGRRVLERGQLYSGASEMGQLLRRPPAIDEPDEFVAYVGWVVPGEHTVSVGYAVTEVISDPEDEWHEASSERYRTGGVLVDPTVLDSDAISPATTVQCDLEASQICTVHVELARSVGHGGVIDYSATVTMP